MDEKEFIHNSSGDKLFDEEINLSNNLSKIDEIIDYNEIHQRSAEEDAQNYRGEYQFYNEFINAQKEAREYKEKVDTLKEYSESPYHMHIYLEEKEHDEDMYIGLNDIVDINGKNIVYSVWSDVAKAFSNSNCRNYIHNGINYDLRFKRNMTIDKRKIVDFVEEYNSQSGKSEEITDYFLRNVLKSKKNIKGFTDIVKTIQDKQNDIIRSDLNTNIVCQGVAGSGKTAIIVHRLSNLLYNNPDIPADKYLFIAPNSNFKSELSALNKKLKIDKIHLNTLYEYYIQKFNYYLEDNMGKFPKYEITNIINDKNSNIKYIYSKEYLEEKFSLLTQYVYENIKEVTNYYNYKIVDSLDYKTNISLLRKTIDMRMSDFNSLKSNINKVFKNIELSVKGIGQSANSYDDINEFDEIISVYNSRCDIAINNYELLISSTESALINQREKIDYDFYSKYSFSKQLINDEIEKLNERIESIREKTSKIENSMFAGFQKNTIDENKKVIEELENEANTLIEKIAIFDSETYDIEWNIYNDMLDKLKKYNNAIKCLNNAKELNNSINYSVIAYSKLKLVNEITEDQVISYKRILKNLLNYIMEKSEIIEPSKIISINELLIQTKEIDEELDYNSYLDDKDNLDILVDAIKPSEIIKSCFVKLLNNKYRLTPDSLQNSKFERNDIVVLLYIFNKLGFSKRKQFNYLYIDEAQDYNDEEIKLINELEGKPIMNIFGDYQQNISTNSITRTNWKTLISSLNNNSVYYELNENYRNTTNVVEYCNSHINSNMSKIGVDGNDVKEIKKINISDLVDLYNNGDYQIITNNIYIINVLKTINSDIKCNTVLDVKGLEFDNIIVINEGLDLNNKYVAYTRTKNDLIIIDNVDIDTVINNSEEDEIENNDINLEQDAKNNIADELKNIEEKEEVKENTLKKENSFINSMSEMTYQKYLEQLIKISNNNGDLTKKAFDNFFELNNISKTWQPRFTKDLARNKIYIKEIKSLKDMSFNNKSMYILEIIGKSKTISDEKLIELLIKVSDDADERDRLYEFVLNNRINVVEE